jgi:hypothetical protein
MSTSQDDPRAQGRQPSEEELRAAYEAEISKVKVEHVLLEQVVTLINLGMRRTGLVPGTESERDPVQVRLAIEAIRVLLPVLEQSAPQQIAPIREALSQLQMAYVKLGGSPGSEPSEPSEPSETPPPPASQAGPGAGEETAPPGSPPPDPGSPPPKAGDPGPAQRSGRLWVPGQ